MKSSRIAFILILISVGFSALPQQLQEIRYDSIACQSSDLSANTFVPPDRTVLEKISARTENASNFDVIYSGFTPEAQAAFQYAIDLWDAIIDTPVPIKIAASWEEISTTTLGYAIWAEIKMPDDTGIQDTWYPISLAEKITGTPLNNANAIDVRTAFNKDANWYYGLDGQTPSGQTDLVTVVLHEIGHGLGISDSFFANSQFGWYGAGNNPEPIIYDRFVVDNMGKTLVDIYSSATPDLGLALQSNQLFFNSPIAAASNGNSLPVLHAPNPFKGGASIAHLSEEVYSPGTINSLMTPTLNRAEAVHDPGPLIRGMLAEMGWIHTYLLHDPVISTELIEEDILVEAVILSDTEIARAEIHYSNDQFSTETIEPLVNTGANNWEFPIPAYGTEETVEYYLLVTDSYGREYRKPRSGTYSFEVGADTQFPVVIHTPEDYVFNTIDDYVIAATVTDNYKVDRVYLTYRLNEGSPVEVDMVATGEDDGYEYIFDFTSLGLGVDDRLEYTITAEDGSLAGNFSVFPETGEQLMRIVGYREPASVYFNDFEGSVNDFVGPGFEISQPDGFLSKAIHSDHPYDYNSSLSYQLLVPIILTDPAVLTFEEVVLVEPGEEGSPFGSSRFKDYVVVEASEDGGIVWRRFEQGYDSRRYSFWEEAWNEDIVDDESTAQGNETMYKKHVVDLLGNINFVPGEEILLRFSLYTNTSVNGWGWAIDNVSINDQVLSAREINSEYLEIYPNPGAGIFQLNTTLPKAKISVYNTSGQLIKVQELDKTIDLSAYNDGVYILQIISDTEVITRRLLKKSY